MHYGKKARGQSQRDAMCMFCSDTSGPAVLLRHVPCAVEMTSPDGCGLFQQDNVSCHRGEMDQGWWEDHKDQFGMLNWPLNSTDLDIHSYGG